MIKNKIIFFSFLTFLLFVVSYSTNIFRITDQNYKQFDRADEGNVLGRMMLSKEKGIFYKGAITGQYFNYKYPLSEIASENPPLRYFEPSIYPLSQLYDDYINDRVTYDGLYHPYKSQPGGQAMLYSALQKILPFSGRINLDIFRLITISLTALCFTLFIGWVYRNFKFTPALVTFLLLFLSPWLFRFAFNLWWALWSFFIPFLTMLLVLEKRKARNAPMFNFSLLLYLFISIFVKFFFTGGEFISSTLVMAVSPIIFYLLQENYSFLAKLTYFVKACVAAIVGIVFGLLQLTIQLKELLGSWREAFSHILYSYTKHNTDSPYMIRSFKETLIYYFNASMFYFPFTNYTISFGQFLVATLVVIVLLFLFQTRVMIQRWKIYKALLITCIISILAPYSWFIFFPAHAAVHVDFDCIVWYMPFLLFAFAVWGIFCREILLILKN